MHRHAPFKPIDPNSCMWGGVHDVINCANFCENRSRGLGAGIPRKTAFLIESVHRPYNSVSTTVLHCDNNNNNNDNQRLTREILDEETAKSEFLRIDSSTGPMCYDIFISRETRECFSQMRR